MIRRCAAGAALTVAVLAGCAAINAASGPGSERRPAVTSGPAVCWTEANAEQPDGREMLCTGDLGR